MKLYSHKEKERFTNVKGERDFMEQIADEILKKLMEGSELRIRSFYPFKRRNEPEEKVLEKREKKIMGKIKGLYVSDIFCTDMKDIELAYDYNMHMQAHCEKNVHSSRGSRFV